MTWNTLSFAFLLWISGGILAWLVSRLLAARLFE